MYPRVVQATTDFRQQHFAIGRVGLGGRRPIAHAIGADDHEVRMRQALLQIGKRPHEHMETAIGFELAADVGDHLVFTRKRATVRQGKASPGIELEDVEIQPLVDHLDPCLFMGGIGRALPVGRTDPRVAGRQRLQLCRVANPQLVAGVGLQRVLRIKADVATLRPIKKLEIGNHARRRKHILNEQQFAPGGVTDNQIGNKAFGPHLLTGPHHILAAPDGRLKARQVMMGV